VSSTVLDASALLALLNQEEGSDLVAELVADGAAIGAVNLAEVATKLSQVGIPEEQIREIIDTLGLEIIPFDAEQVYRAALLVGPTRSVGLSLGDRACLALAAQVGVPAVTADRVWRQLELGVKVRVVR